MPGDEKELIQIAVTGHRFINDLPALTASIEQVLMQILRDHPGADYQLLSALAEGSDQLVARVALQNELIKLCVPLPLPRTSYLRNFETEAGKAMLDHLLKSADQVTTLKGSVDPVTAYQALASYLVDTCTVLIALWNGVYSGKRGGTGEVVKRALEAGKLVYWIYCEDLRVGVENSLGGIKQHAEIQQLGMGSE